MNSANFAFWGILRTSALRSAWKFVCKAKNPYSLDCCERPLFLNLLFLINQERSYPVSPVLLG